VNAFDFGGAPTQPLARDDVAAALEDTALTINVLANDTDPVGGGLSIIAATDPQNGRIRVNGQLTISYAPSADFHGTDAFTYQIADIHGETDLATVQVVVTPTNDDPIARPDKALTSGDMPIAMDLLANDSDPDGDALRIRSVSNPDNGAAVLAVDGRVTYIADTGFYGDDIFGYTVEDAFGGSAAGLATVTVQPTAATPRLHVADLDASASGIAGGWQAIVTITVAHRDGIPVPGAIVTGGWRGVRGATQCVTDADGICALASSVASPWADAVGLAVADVAATGFAFDPSTSTDPDGDSDGRLILIQSP
jgi:hypothetical protein